jgi:beta-lactamase regulating signal transducer with metallopeptidase domain
MNLAQTLSSYINLNILIVIGFAGLAAFAGIIKLAKMNLSAVTVLKLHYATLAAIVVVAALQPLLPKNQGFTAVAKVWSSPTLESFNSHYDDSRSEGYLSLTAIVGPKTVKAEHFKALWSFAGLLFLLLGGFVIGRDLRILLRTKRNSFYIRKIGRVQILASDSIQVPFSFWLPGQANIIVPSSLLEKSRDYKIAVAHELQHHRHGDTKWVHVMWGLKLACAINPAIYLWNRWITEIQEFACDETLVDQRKVESQKYARCLVEVAELAVNQKYVPVCATGLTFQTERNLLKRRIEKMFTKAQNKKGSAISVSVFLLLGSMLGASAYASRDIVQDRRVSLTQAQDMAANAQGDFPVVVNERVLKQLNRYIGTPEGREFMRDSLQRMKAYEGIIGKYVDKYGLPSELLAIPIIESGYQNNHVPNDIRIKAAGLWQFIVSTARNYGLKVDDVVDERLDVPLATDAAMRYLQSNYLRFKDWQLATLAYNTGENAVQKGIVATGSRDAWTLIRNGHEGDKDYLPKLMAAILIMKNPDSVE